MPKKPPTKAEREYLGMIAGMGCCICGQPSEAHHITSGVGMGQRASHYDTIPLCPDHHRHGGHGVAIHAGKATWEVNFGSELEILAEVKEELREHDPDYDPTPWCHGCGAREAAQCDCGPIADNE